MLVPTLSTILILLCTISPLAANPSHVQSRGFTLDQALAQARNLQAAINALRIQTIFNSLAKNNNKNVLSTSGSNNVIKNCNVPGTFAMTFDDGPAAYGSQIAQYIVSKGGLATFFVNGLNYDCIYDKADELRARYNAGHQIAAHTWGHDRITNLSDDELNNQITLLETALWKILGIRPAFFRPPYGSSDARTVAILAARGYTTVTWDYASGDASGVSPNDSLNGYYNLAAYPAPHNVLNHETYETTANQVVPNIVPKLIAQGYKLVTVATCLNLPPYAAIGTPQNKDSSWTCAGTPLPGQPHKRSHFESGKFKKL